MNNRIRTVIARGIYRDKFGVAIVVSVEGKPREFRKTEHGRSYAGWSIDALKAERVRVQARERLKVERQAVKGEAFTADVDRYLRTIQSPTHLRNATGLLKHWCAIFGDRHRNEITDMEIREEFARFDKAPSTLNHLRHVLIAFYATLNGRTGHNPARVLKKVRERYDDARALPYETIQKIFDALQPSPTKARLMVMAYTGLPQAQIERLQPHDVRLAKRAIYVRPRRKGAGVAGKMLPLSTAGVKALKEFTRLHAFGTFQRKQLQATFANGIEWSGVSVPDGTRPYDLRHSFLTEVYRQTGDLNAVAELGMHATLEQTARYARGAVSERAEKAVRATNLNRGTTPERSNSFQLGRVVRKGAPGSNQYRKRSKSGNSQRKQPLVRS